MKIVKLIHNPTAGDEHHDEETLIKSIESQGYQCRYSSTKEHGWQTIGEDLDMIVIAGGDGTVRKVIKEILKRDVLDKDIPLALLPMGTANNFAKALGLPGNPKKIIKSLGSAKLKAIDVGRIYNIDETNFFIESFGFGIFPYLMQVMKKEDKEYDSPQEELKGSLNKLHEIIVKYESRQCKLEIDDSDHSGKFILAEVMNTKSIGPNIPLAPLSDPGDDQLEVVLVPEKHKDKFADYIDCLRKGENVAFQFYTMQAKKVKISWEGTHAHVDDKIVKLDENQEICLEVKHGVLQFLVPPDDNGDD